jgi:hypothetical protein
MSYHSPTAVSTKTEINSSLAAMTGPAKYGTPTQAHSFTHSKATKMQYIAWASTFHTETG